MFLQLGVELVPTLDILLLHFRKLGCPGLLLFSGTLTEVEFESRSGDVCFLTCWQEENEVPLFLGFGDGVHSEVISEQGQ